VLSDEDGLKVDGSEVVYAPFGEIREGDLSDLTDFGFTGQQLDRSTGGLMYYGARYYLPELRRFISADTIVPGATNPQAFNRYSYVLNNPLKFIDPSGHAVILPTPGNPKIFNTPTKAGGGGGGGDDGPDPTPGSNSGGGGGGGKGGGSEQTDPLVGDPNGPGVGGSTAPSGGFFNDGVGGGAIENVDVDLPTWKPEYLHWTTPEERAAAEQAYLHLQSDPAYFVPLYVDPHAAGDSEEYTYLQLYAELGEFDVPIGSANDMIYVAIGGEFGWDFAGALTDVQRVNTTVPGDEPAIRVEYLGPVAAGGRGLWQLTSDKAPQVMQHLPTGRKYYQDTHIKQLWWTKDDSGHAAFKIYEKQGNRLLWVDDADQYGTYLRGAKHKGPRYDTIPMKDMKRTK